MNYFTTACKTHHVTIYKLHLSRDTLLVPASFAEAAKNDTELEEAILGEFLRVRLQLIRYDILGHLAHQKATHALHLGSFNPRIKFCV